MTDPAPRREVSVLRSRLLPPLLELIGGCSMYAGAAAAVLLFDLLVPIAVAWLRLVGAALVLLVVVRPGRAAWRGRALWVATLYGLCTSGMNMVFYEAISRLPLGTVVALEFLGPVAVAAVGSRSVRDWVALALAGVGVVLVADVHLVAAPLGVALSLLAGALWAGYVLLGSRIAAGGRPVDSMTVGFCVSAVVLSPSLFLVVRDWTPETPTLAVLGSGVLLGVASTVVPYLLDQVVLRTAGRAYFAVLLALLPVSAVLMGLFVLGQVPGPVEVLGIALVAVAVALRKAA